MLERDDYRLFRFLVEYEYAFLGRVLGRRPYSIIRSKERATSVLSFFYFLYDISNFFFFFFCTRARFYSNK